MAISIDWASKVISVPQADLTPLGGSLYELDVDAFRLTLKDLEDDEAGITFLHTHNHTPETTLAGTTFARQIEIINGYTVTFEDGQYRVRLVGANNNIVDVANLNQVSIIPTNSAGLVSVATPTQIAQSVWAKDVRTLTGIGSSGIASQESVDVIANIWQGRWMIDGSRMTLYEPDGETVIQAFDLYDKNGNLTGDPTKAFERRPI